MNSTSTAPKVAAYSRLLGGLYLFAISFGVAGLRLAVLAAVGSKALAVNLTVTAVSLLIILALTHPRVRTWQLASLRRLASRVRR